MSDTQVTPPISTETPSDTGKILAAVGYVIWVVAIIAILIEPYKNEKFVRLHALQAIALLIAGFILSVVSIIPILGWIVAIIGSIAIAVMAIMGIVKSLQGEYWQMPWVYSLVSKYI